MRKSKTVKAIAIALIILFLIPAVPSAIMLVSGSIDRGRCEKAQAEHMEALRWRYTDPGFAPINENDFAAFDLPAALESGVKLNEVQFLATHNSYKRPLSPAARLAMNAVGLPLGLTAVKDEFDYGHEPLTSQLDRGIRSLEFDIERGGEGFRVGHIGVLDINSNCPDFLLACEELRMWSEANPDHLPITLLLESKSAILTGGALYRPFDTQDLMLLESLIEQAFGGMLLTPGEALRDYENFAALRRADDWPPLRDLLGKILVIYHYSEGTTGEYIALDPSLRTQKMFPSLWYPVLSEVDTEYASFVLCNEPLDYAGEIAAFTAENLLVRTRLDMHNYPGREQSYALGADSGALLLSTDYPPRGGAGEDGYTALLEGGYTVQLR